MIQVARYLRSALTQAHHPSWMILQQVIVRGLQAAKFLLAARMLSPEQVGLVGIALICLAIAEGMSDTGLSQAVVQSPRSVNRWQAGAIWTLQVTRGTVIAICLVLFSTPVAWFFEAPDSASLLTMAGGIALLRNSFNPGLYVTQRHRDFRKLSIYEIAACIVDITLTLFLIRLNTGPASMLIGSMAGEATKSAVTWSWFRIAIRPTLHWHLINKFTKFGRWIWGSSIITLFLNQADKILVARFLGTTELGLYQVASRIAQLVISDAFSALGQYLYPNFCQRYRESPNSARMYFARVVRLTIPFTALLAVALATFSSPLITLILGPQWTNATSIVRILSIAMTIGALIAITAPYVRAIGSPQWVTIATALQFAALLLLAPMLIIKWGSIGMACATTIALLMPGLYLSSKVR